MNAAHQLGRKVGRAAACRDQLHHPQYQKPQLLANAPNQVWSWDITKLLGPVNWTYFYLYLILDIFSRYVVGWMVVNREMRYKPVALLLADLGVTHSRPHVSDDNPFSESHFKTLKYRPEFPDRFGSIQDAGAFCQAFFPWYNTEHHHSGIGLLTPEVLHYGRADEIIGQRQTVLSQAYERNPKRFVRAAGGQEQH
jgi:putative transposase